MTRIHRLAASMAIGVVLMVGLPAAAHAQQAATPQARTGTLAAGDGYFYAWENAYQGGTRCRWFNSDGNWGDDCGNFRNRASSVWNNSAHGNYANLYFHPNSGGAYACIAPGDYWDNLINYYFTWGPADGKNKPTNDEIASFAWTTTQCGR